MLSKEIKNYLSSHQFDLNSIQEIKNSASNRKYYRIQGSKNSSILTYSPVIKENTTFLYLADLFKSQGIHVPEIYYVNDEKNFYLQEDIGSLSLFSLVLKEQESEQVKKYYQKAINELLKVQLVKDIDYSLFYDFNSFNKQMIFNDLMYFKFYFLQLFDIPFQQKKIMDDFDSIATELSEIKEFKGFMYRDFQSRNIFIFQNECYFIDFQGGVEGVIIYDLVSLLWQAKADFSVEWKEDLKNYYFNQLNKILTTDKDTFERIYRICVIVRSLQVMGAYGLRGKIENKTHFLDSISPGIKNLKYLLNNNYFNEYPELKKTIQKIKD